MDYIQNDNSEAIGVKNQIGDTSLPDGTFYDPYYNLNSGGCMLSEAEHKERVQAINRSNSVLACEKKFAHPPNCQQTNK